MSNKYKVSNAESRISDYDPDVRLWVVTFTDSFQVGFSSRVGTNSGTEKEACKKAVHLRETVKGINVEPNHVAFFPV